MKTFKRSLEVIAFAIILALGSQEAHAVKVTSFVDTPTYIHRGKDIIIAQCKSLAKIPERPLDGGLDVWEVDVVKVLKGNISKGSLRVVSLYHLMPSKTYLLYSLGGSAYGSEFLAIPELSVVELPPEFDMVGLNGKTANEQVDTIIAARLDQVRREIERIERERLLLEKATQDQEQPEQNGTDQPATAPDSKSEGKEKPKPESEGRSK